MKSILLIEDDPAISKALTASLSAAGYRVLYAEDGLSGLNAAKEKKPDLILLDIMLPSMNGFEICAELKKSGFTFPVFMLTSLGEDKRRMQGLEAGADEYITKPFSLKELLLRIKNTLSREEMIHEHSRELEEQLSKAREIQINSLPKSAPVIKGVDIFAEMRPAAVVGGDYFDFISLSEDRIGIIIADVCGKGMPAAMLVQKMQGIVCSLNGSGLSGKDIMMFIYGHLRDSLPKNGFITASLFVYRSYDCKAELYRAGHLSYIIKTGAELSEIRPRGLWIGPMPAKAFEENLECVEISLKPGTVIAMYTDGVTECTNPDGKEFGPEGIKSFLVSAAGTSTEAGERLLGELDNFRSQKELNDDTTIIIITGT